MPKKLKLNLDDLKIQSFITALTEEEKHMVRGGGTTDDCDTTTGPCNTQGGSNCNPTLCFPTICQTQCTSADTCC